MAKRSGTKRTSGGGRASGGKTPGRATSLRGQQTKMPESSPSKLRKGSTGGGQPTDAAGTRGERMTPQTANKREGGARGEGGAPGGRGGFGGRGGAGTGMARLGRPGDPTRRGAGDRDQSPSGTKGGTQRRGQAAASRGGRGGNARA